MLPWPKHKAKKESKGVKRKYTCGRRYSTLNATDLLDSEKDNLSKISSRDVLKTIASGPKASNVTDVISCLNERKQGKG